ncbi:MAG: NTPase [Candidatus Geothermarchaeales archaeon]
MTAFFLTGQSGVGKTTVIEKIFQALRNRGLRVGGMITREVRKGGIRVGFEIIDLASGARGWLAHVDQAVGPRVGKYRVNLEDLDNIGVGALLRSVEEADIIVCDEIGPMELASPRFREALSTIVGSGKTILATIHQRYSERPPEEVRRAPDSTMYRITFMNRDNVPLLVIKRIMESMGKREG